MSMRQETVDEYLKRGGTISKMPLLLNTVGKGWRGESSEDTFDGGSPLVSWESIQPDKRFDTDDDDRKYWNKLNKRCDKLLKKLKVK